MATDTGCPPRGRDHPRVRGDHWLLSLVPNGLRGPSLHARGPQIGHDDADVVEGAIPARAGTTGWANRARSCWRGHPRVRGDHGGGETAPRSVGGPSPRARGPLVEVPATLLDHGSIPACAGTTSAPFTTSRTSRVHPRVRGDHTHPEGPEDDYKGPSPRARGPRGVVEGQGDGLGSIPACAGTTSPRTTPTRRPWVHPRVRGDHYSGRSITVGRRGPSPRARGPRVVLELLGLRLGSIPACAGTTKPA